MFHCGSLLVFSPLCCDPALSVFASKCQGECHAVKAALCDLGAPGWIPGFRVELCCFLHPSRGPWCLCFVSLLACIMGLRNMTHKLSSACAEMILSYHLSPQQIFFTHKLEPVTSLLCFSEGVRFFVGCFCLGLFLALFLVLILGVSVFVLLNVTKE